jgi:HK97 family phage portal protein
VKFWRTKSDDTATITDPTPWLLSLFGGTAVGDCSRGQALALPAVSAAIRAISEAAATLGVNVVEIADDGTETVDHNHPLVPFLSDAANDWTSSFEFIRDLVIRALVDDQGGLAWVNRVSGEVREIILLPEGRISVQYRWDTGEPVYRLAGVVTDSANIIHLRSPFGRSPLSMAMSAITVATLMETHAKNLFKNGSKPSGWIGMAKGLGDEGLKKMRTAWKAAFEGADNAGRTPILWDDAKFHALTLSSTDAQFLENRTYQNLEIARGFRVPPQMLYELGRATWKNSEQGGKEFLTYTMEPWLHALEACLRRALFNDDDRKTHRIRFERDDLTRASLTERATAINSLIASETINPNTGRAWLDLPPYTGGEAYGNRNITVKPVAVPDAQVDAPV